MQITHFANLYLLINTGICSRIKCTKRGDRLHSHWAQEQCSNAREQLIPDCLGGWLSLCSSMKHQLGHRRSKTPWNPRRWRSSPGHGALSPSPAQWYLSTVLVGTGGRPKDPWVEGAWRDAPGSPGNRDRSPLVNLCATQQQ